MVRQGTFNLNSLLLFFFRLEHVESVESAASDDDVEIENSCIRKLSPLKHGDKVIELNYGDTIIGLQSLSILKQVPSYKGIVVRVPEYYVLDEISKREISLVPHLKAITILIRSFMSRKILDHNIRLRVTSNNIFFFSYSNSSSFRISC